MTHERHEHGPMVEAWLKEPTWLPETDLERVSRLVHQTPQRRSWLPPPGPTRSKIMLSATTVVTSIAAIALTVEVLLNGLAPAPPPVEPLPAAGETATSEALEQEPQPTLAVETEQPGPEVTEDAPRITLPDPLPEEVIGGTISTPAGPARWARMSADTGIVPRPGTAVLWGDGLAVWETETQLPNGGRGRLWVTTDGTSWRPETLPQELQKRPSKDHTMWMERLSGAYFLYEPSTGRLWRRDEDSEWRPLDTSAVAEARPSGWSVGGPWFPRPQYVPGPRMVDGEPIFWASYLYQLPRQGLGLLGRDTRRMHRLEKNRYALCPDDDPECSAKDAAVILRFRATEDGLVVRDDRTGERYGLLRGAEPSELYEGKNRRQWHTFKLEGDMLVPIDAPRRASANSVEEPAPPGLPENAYATQLDSGWVAVEWPAERGAEPGSWWLHLGGEWVDLAEFGFPELRPYETRWIEAGTGNATLLWFEDPERDMASLWVITAPEER